MNFRIIDAMKLRTIIIACISMLICSTAMAQPQNGKKPSREEFVARQAEYICRQMAFDDDVAAKFKDAFAAYQNELWALGPRVRPNGQEKSSEEEIQDRFEKSQQILDLRKKYYETYSKFLTQRQISRVYEIEREMMHRLSQGKKGQPNNRPQHRK